jgi:hypothetical protein
MTKKKAKPPLSKTHPKLAKEADGWDPSSVRYSDKTTKAWKCKLGHKWKAKPNSRTKNSLNSEPTSCPVCTGRNILVGFNDLKTLNPLIASEADGWDPSSVGKSRGMKKWKCKLGHKWSATVSNRTFFNSKCPYCLNQKTWPGFNDLATTHPKLAKEADGWDPRKISAGSHKKLKWKCTEGHVWNAFVYSRSDSKGSGCPTCANKIVKVGFNDLKTTNPSVASEADGWDPTKVVAGSHKIVKWKCKKGHIWETPIINRALRTRGCPTCANYKLLVGFNDLATTFPEIAKQADGWDTSSVVYGSEKRMPWICSYGHKWTISVNKRTGQNSTHCPVCSGKKLLVGFNDLATTFPIMAKEADGWDPRKISAGSHKKLKWKCTEGHVWTISPHGRKRGKSNCPTCASSGYDPNSDAWLYFLKHDQWMLFQIGITNFPDQRLSRHKKNGWRVLEIRGPMDGNLTLQWETAILKMLKSSGADLSNKEIAGKFDGYTESWSQSTFLAKSIKDLMRLTEEFEETS